MEEEKTYIYTIHTLFDNFFFENDIISCNAYSNTQTQNSNKIQIKFKCLLTTEFISMKIGIECVPNMKLIRLKCVQTVLYRLPQNYLSFQIF